MNSSDSGRPQGPNFVLVVADTTRADALGPGTGGGVAPALAAAASDGRTYLRATSPSPWTAPAHASLFTGLAPSEHGIWRPNLFDDESRPRPKPVRGEVAERWLPVRLAAAGYRTLGISANPWVAPYFGFDHGFERFQATRDKGAAWSRRSMLSRLGRKLPIPVAARLRRRPLAAKLRRLGPDAGARQAVATMSTWLAESKRPFFAFLNLMEAHWPYRPPLDFEGFSAAEVRRSVNLLARLGQFKAFQLRALFEHATLAPEDLAMLRRLYMGEVTYLDSCLRELLDRLDDAGRLHDTVVVVMADHGEQLGEHGLFGHGSSLYEELLHVPLLVLGPAELVGRGAEPAWVSTQGLYQAFETWTRAEAATLVDAVPVVAENEGLWYQPAVRRAPAAAARQAELKATSWALYDRSWKYVRSDAGVEALYDLAADPGETTDLSATGPLGALRRRLADVLTARRPALRGAEGGDGGRDAAVEAELRALGYL
jgi:arylsulfatase A-like enzyme